ncbi:probable aldo-keto reductase 1 isoform X1 [Populus trichocarpa]|uniref:probable aldo-keto reductase 1 isoform X1 n=1 Tax=Populus trichocarpa TaxID=3694 RepID=UPI000D188357|nr:probable aldo-keto reductase 1 isoform X1 [Populus trichocarpa]|eukprot:XP_024439511.1 probable aldo-keto reductase 1 isoform X1 [Populus trichocarpa]
MAEEQKVIIPRVKLGNQGLEVSKLGFGCMGLSGIYNAPLPEEVGISIIKEAYSKGITFFDTADVYGPHTNEILVGKALKHLPREKIQLATKFGIVPNGSDFKNCAINGSPEYIRACCDASLKRLDLDYIDLYYQHRTDTSVPIEETVCSFPFFHHGIVQTNCVHYLISNPITLSWQMGELKKLVEEGKVKYIGLSEASPDTIKRAHAVHPISAVQMEWSLWSRDIEEEIIPLCRELGIAVVPYSPIGRGFFGGRAVVKSLSSESLLKLHPRFTEENIEKNKVFYSRIEKLAAKHGCTPAQLALAWVINQGDDVVPIPGTTKIKNLYDNVGSLQVKLTKEDLKEISDAVPINEVAGVRSPQYQLTWKFADTPQPKNSQV